MKVLDTFSLEGQTALVTGGNRGLGRAMAQALGEAGAAVAVTARSLADAQVAAAELKSLGIKAYPIALEVSDPKDVERVVATVSEEFGEIDILINNAGIAIPEASFDHDDEHWREVMSINVDGVWYCSRTVAKRMASRGGGRIVNIGSIVAQIVTKPRWQISYLTSKAAVHRITEGLAAEWAPYGIRVNAIAPGFFLTDQSPVDQPEFYADCIEPAPMKRWGEPRELGPLVVYLASEASSFVTGSIFKIDGGYTLF